MSLAVKRRQHLQQSLYCIASHCVLGTIKEINCFLLDNGPKCFLVCFVFLSSSFVAPWTFIYNIQGMWYHDKKEEKSKRGPLVVSLRGWHQTEGWFCRPVSPSNPLQTRIHQGEHLHRRPACVPGCSNIWQRNNVVRRSICMTASSQVCKHS